MELLLLSLVAFGLSAFFHGVWEEYQLVIDSHPGAVKSSQFSSKFGPVLLAMFMTIFTIVWYLQWAYEHPRITEALCAVPFLLAATFLGSLKLFSWLMRMGRAFYNHRLNRKSA